MSSLEIVKNGLDLLHVNNSLNVAIVLLQEYNDAYKYFSNQYIYKNNKSLIIQNGGNDTDTEEFIHDKIKLKFNVVDIGHMVTYTIYKNNDYEKRSECLIIMINKEDKEDKEAHLSSITYDKQCFTKENAQIYNTCGSLLLLMGIKFIIKLKKRYNLKYITLKDNSSKICHGKNINLALLRTFISGDTWYGKHGFRPRSNNLAKYDIDETLLKYYKKNKQIVLNTKINDVPFLKKYLEK
jgi:hypothetical protein